MLTVKDLPLDFEPRPYQGNILHAFFKRDPIKRAFIVWSRRTGKDRVSWAIMLQKALQRKGNYYVIFPTARQARKAVWLGIGGDSVSFLDHIPEKLIEKINNTEMRIHLVNKSIIQLIGAANYNHAMGTSPMGLIYSEYALQSPLAYSFLYPIVVENNGWIIVNTTPRSHNHAYRLFHSVCDNEKWYTSLETVATCVDNEGKHIITAEQIEEARSSGMSYQLIKQEFFCDWESAMEDSYFADYLGASRKAGRITTFPMPQKQLYTFWDLGMHDMTCITIVAFSDSHIQVVDFYQNNGKGLEFYVNWINRYKERYNVVWGKHFAPHDVKVREYGSGQSRIVTAMELGLYFTRIPRPAVKKVTIDEARGIFHWFTFHKTNCQTLLDALAHYHARKNEKGGESGPDHDYSSHPCDSFLLITQAFNLGLLPLKKFRPNNDSQLPINKGPQNSIMDIN